MISVTQKNFGKESDNKSGLLLFRSALSPPEYHQPKTLPAQVRRQDQKPGNDIAGSDLGTQGTEKVAITETAISAKYRLADVVNDQGHDRQAQKQEHRKQCQLFGCELPYRGCAWGGCH